MADIVSRIYSNFRGVDFRGEDVNLTRSPDSLNMWKDYKQTNSIRTRPGMVQKLFMGHEVYGIYFFKGKMLVHSGSYLHEIDPSQSGRIYDIEAKLIQTDLREEPGQAFVYNDVWYFKQDEVYISYNGTEDFADPVEPYVPTTSIGRNPGGGGTVKEDVNMLTQRRINTFMGDATSTEYFLDSPKINYVFSVKVDGEEWAAAKYSVDYTAGKITFSTAPGKPKTPGQDNVSIEFNGGDYQTDKIYKCTIVEVFDNRVFFSGNPDYPNMVWHSSLNDPSYVSDLDYYQEGRDEAPIRGLVAGNNALWVFREPSDEQTTVFYHVPTLDADYGKIYPSSHSSISTGCVGKAINFNDDIVFFSDRGMEGISGDITSEQLLGHRSSLVDRKLTAEEKYKDMILAEWEGYLLVFIGNKVYLADSRGVFNNENHFEYEWFYWDIGLDVTCAKVHDGVLYIGDPYGVYTLDENGSGVKSYWVTAKDKFNNPHKLKTTNKRGCVVEATGDITVYAKLEDTDFELIGNYEEVTDYFVSRIKRKKFKDIQLKFESFTRFSLETATLECFIGGYIKR